MPAKKNPKKADPMLGALAASFGAAKPAPAAQKETERAEPKHQQGRGAQMETSPPPPAIEIARPLVAAPPDRPAPARQPEASGGGGVKKTTVSFHENEQDKIEASPKFLTSGTIVAYFIGVF